MPRSVLTRLSPRTMLRPYEQAIARIEADGDPLDLTVLYQAPIDGRDILRDR